MRCAIHQPNFFPWLGYFHKIATADVFVFLDDVQYEKSGKGTWGNRVKLLISGEPKWFTAPVKRPKGTIWNVNETNFQDTNWRDKLYKTLVFNYSKAPFFDKYHEQVKKLIDYECNNMSDYNINVIRELCEIFQITDTSFVKSSEINTGTSSTQKLIDLTLAAKCKTYLSGNGASGYMEDSMFEKAGLSLEFQDFTHPVYPQNSKNEFCPGLSAIDYLFNCGGVKPFKSI